MILTVGSTKGGTGKTTLALQLALALARVIGGVDVLCQPEGLPARADAVSTQ